MYIVIITTLLLWALFCVKILNIFFKIEVSKNKFPAIEGIRGYLAYFVFLHHSYIWYYYLHIGEWTEPKIKIFNQLGIGSVSIFFIITAFLFTNKLLSKKEINWLFFLKNRFFRLFPIYIIAISILIFIVLILSNFKLNVPIGYFINQCFNWVIFTFTSQGDINNIENTFIIISGVTWTLKYEILFYSLLPFLYFLITKRKENIFTIFISLILAILFFAKEDVRYILFLYFLGGILVAFLSHYNKLKFLHKNILLSSTALIGFILNLFLFHSSENIISVIILTFLFANIICENKIFSIIKGKTSQVFGQISYSMYLFHGIILFILNIFVIKREYLLYLDIFQFLLLIGFIGTFFVILISFIMYKYIELPFIKTR